MTSNALYAAGAQDFPFFVNCRNQSHDQLPKKDDEGLDLGNPVIKIRGLQLHFCHAQIQVPVQVSVMAKLPRNPREDLPMLINLTLELRVDPVLRLFRKATKIPVHHRLSLFLLPSGMYPVRTAIQELLILRFSNHKIHPRVQCLQNSLLSFPGVKAINLEG